MQATTNVPVFSFDSFVVLFLDYNCEIRKTVNNINTLLILLCCKEKAKQQWQ